MKTLTLFIFILLIAGSAANIYAQDDGSADIQKYTQALKSAPSDARLYVDRGVAYITAKKYDAALADAMRAIELDPKIAEAYALRGYVYEMKNDDARAMADYTAAIDLRAGFVYAYRRRGLVAKKIGNYAVASTDLTLALGRDRSDTYLLSELADMHMLRKCYDLAIPYYSRMIEVKPEEVRFWELRMDAYHAQGKPELIWKDYEQLLARHPDKGEVLLRRARRASALDKFDIAKADYSALTKLYPNDLEILRLRAGVYRDAGDHDLAIADYTRLTRSKPSDAGPLQSRAYAHSLKGDLDSAVADYTAAIKLDPEADDAYTQRAWVLIEQGKLVSALADANKVLQLMPKYFNAYFTRGHIYVLMGKKDPAKLALALADFDKALAINPKGFAGYHGRSELFVAQKKYGAAADEAAKLIDLNPEAPTGWVLRAIANYHANKKDAALADLDRGLSLKPREYLRKFDLVKAYAIRAELNCLAGRSGEAVADEKLVTELGGTFKKCSAGSTAAKDVAVRPALDPAKVAEAKLDIARYTDFAQKNPTNPNAYTFRGTSYEDVGEDDKALADYNKAIEVAPVSYAGYLFRARFYRKRGRYELAIPDFTKAIELTTTEDSRQNLLKERGQAYRQWKKFDLALADSVLLNTRGPSWEGDQLRIMVLADQGKLALAESELKAFQARHDHPNPALIAFVLCKAGKKAEAAEYEATLSDYEVLEKCR